MRQSGKRGGYDTSHQWSGSRPSLDVWFSIIAVVLAAIVFAALYFGVHWNRYLIWIIAWSVVTFIYYVFDKAQAQRQGLRVPEKVLHVLALVGGFPGGWLGMFALPHKIRHIDFWAVLILATLVHGCIIYVWFIKP